jgi:RNA polymerase sigma-70 factor (ECF subfamily)
MTRSRRGTDPVPAKIADLAATSGTARPPADGSDFEGFYLRNHQALYASMWLVTRNRFEAEEIAQDAFLKVLERWGTVVELDDPDGYLFRTAMNLWRSRGRRVAVAVRKAVHVLSADDSIAAVEGREDMIRVLGRLTKRQRAALVLTGLLDLTSDEAAEVLGIRASTVRVLVSRARLALREGMEP